MTMPPGLTPQRLGAALAGVTVFALLASGIGPAGWLAPIDRALNAAITGALPAAALPVLGGLTHLGDMRVLWLVAAAAVVAMWWRGARRVALGYALGAALGGVWIRVLKAVFDRSRPEHLHDVSVVISGASFPSGHAMGSTVVYGLLACLAARVLAPGGAQRAVTLAALLAALLAGSSRALLSVHWPSDVLAGWALGVAWVAVVLVWMEAGSSTCHRRTLQ